MTVLYPNLCFNKVVFYRDHCSWFIILFHVLFFIGISQGHPDSVVVGLAPDKFSYGHMNQAFW